jgi:hypothetical protein
MSPPPININDSDITGATIDGQEVGEITVDGDVVFSAVPDSLVAHWTFDNADTSGSTAIDIVGGNNGTLSNVTTGVSGANQTYTTNEAYQFNDSNSIIDGIGDLGVDWKQPFSVACWVNFDPSQTIHNIMLADGNTGRSFQLTVDNREGNANAEFNFPSGGTNAQNSGYDANEWYHFVGVWDGSIGYLYVDGTEAVSVSSSGPSASTQPLTYGGGDFTDDHMGGELDDPRVYNKALSDTEVSNLFNNGSI